MKRFDAFLAALVLSLCAAHVAVACNPIPQATYRHLAFSSFSYSSGQITVNYGAGANVSCAVLRVGLQKSMDVTPGTAFTHTINTSGARVDITGVANDGTDYDFITPIWHPSCSSSIPAPTDAPIGTCSIPGTCRTDPQVSCSGNIYVSASCSGQTGGCFDFSKTGIALCYGMTTSRAGAVTTTAVSTDEQSCP